MYSFQQSQLWEDISKEIFANTANLNLENFRDADSIINSRLATWGPYEKSSYRFYKNILYNEISRSEDLLNILSRISNRKLGSPIQVNYKNIDVCFDYLFSAQECLFLSGVTDKIKSVTEIGAGFGRTCHAIIELHNHIQEYNIIDLPYMLEVSKSYLKEVLSVENYNKINFLENTMTFEIKKTEMVINIDSMQEMDSEIVYNYLRFINDRSKYFYTRNTVGKYHPNQIGMKEYDEDKMKIIMELGLCKNLIDIFSYDSLDQARLDYLKLYKPSKSWNLAKDQISFPWQYYHHALYKNNMVSR